VEEVPLTHNMAWKPTHLVATNFANSTKIAPSAADADVDGTPEVVRIYVQSWNDGFGKRMRHIDAERIKRWRRDLSDATSTTDAGR
jgi:hypothetical protein